MRKIYIFLIMISLSFLFGYVYNKGTKKDGNNDKVFDNTISIPPILNDDKIPLETSSLNREEMIDIINMVTQNTLTGVGGNYLIEDANKISPIKQIRKCIKTEDFYNVYKIKGGRFYVFYGECRSIPNQIVSYCYAEKKLLFSDFVGIKIGVSTIDDVKRIDDVTDYFSNGKFTPFKLIDGENIVYDDHSIHMTKEGVVSIGYKDVHGKLYVDYIKKHKEEMISGINELDLP